MSAPRSYFGIEVVDEQLFVVGGFNGVTTMMSVERYDEEAGMWYDASNTRVPCSGLSCSVLHGNHEVVEKLFPRDATTLANVQEAAGGSVWPSAQSWHVILSFKKNKIILKTMMINDEFKLLNSLFKWRSAAIIPLYVHNFHLLYT